MNDTRPSRGRYHKRKKRTDSNMYKMHDNSVLLCDNPPYDRTLIRAIAFACFFVQSPIYLLIVLSEPTWGIWALLLWFLVPALAFAIPYLLIIPTRIELTSTTLRIKHGMVWTTSHALDDVVDFHILDYPPWWVNFQYFFPYAQWIRVEKRNGWLKSWYIPTTSATRLVVAIRGLKHHT